MKPTYIFIYKRCDSYSIQESHKIYSWQY